MTSPAPAPLYPLRFEPIFRSMLWGGRRLPGFLRRPGAASGPVGEAWVLSDLDGNSSVVQNGPLSGTSLRDLTRDRRRELLGDAGAPGGRFPLLLKFIDAAQELSVQVHPCDRRAGERHPGQFGKTEAWVILDANPATSRLYAGFRDGSSPERFAAALTDGSAPSHLHRFTPAPGDCVFLPAGTVHAIGADLLLFEVQQTSDLTYRLYDWDRVDPKTGRGRELHVDDALACADFGGPVRLTKPSRNGRPGHEHLVACPHFTLERTVADAPTTVGAAGECRAVVVIAGNGLLAGEPVAPGDVVLLPASVGAAELVPVGGPVTALECGVPG